MTHQLLCNACGRYSDNKKNAGRLPPPEVLARRHRRPKKLGSKEEIAQRRCSSCGAPGPGTRMNAKWNRHPVTREGWYCEHCYDAVRRQLAAERKEQDARGRGAAGDGKAPSAQP